MNKKHLIKAAGKYAADHAVQFAKDAAVEAGTSFLRPWKMLGWVLLVVVVIFALMLVGGFGWMLFA